MYSTARADRERRPVDARMRERVVDVGDRDDAGSGWNRGAGEATRIAASVPALVVMQGDAARQAHPGAGFAVEQQRADHGVGLDDLALDRIERARLREDAMRHRELADVVHRGGKLQGVPLLLGPAHLRGE